MFDTEKESGNLARRRGQRKGWLRPDHGSWLLTYRVYSREYPKGQRITVTIGPAEGAGKLTKKQAERFSYDHYLKAVDTTVMRPLSTLTVEQFWEKKYEPHLRKNRKYATQSQYCSIWACWLKPALGTVKVFEWAPDHVDLAISRALAAGRSTTTAKHIRTVASAIFSYAKRMRCATGDNPAQAVEPITVEPVQPGSGG